MSPQAPPYNRCPGESRDPPCRLRSAEEWVRAFCRDPTYPLPRNARSGEFAFRRKDGLFFRDDIEDPILAFVHVEDELADEGLVILLAQRLVALREVVAFLQFETFQRLNQLWRVLAPAEA